MTEPHRQDDGLLALADEIAAEADNISPTNRTHPAGVMMKWAERLRTIATPASDGAEGTGSIVPVSGDDPSPYDWEDRLTEPSAVDAAILANREKTTPPKPAPDAPREAVAAQIYLAVCPQTRNEGQIVIVPFEEAGGITREKCLGAAKIVEAMLSPAPVKP